jgi:flavin reductase (DIM6/NTAB) family NADH-FMN oxidoreductase RutF
MSKVAIGPGPYLYPMPVLLVGANVGDKPNFMAVAWGGIADSEPPMVTVAIRHSRYTIKGFSHDAAFSVNIPSRDMVREADFCGMASGARVDKTARCGFKVSYGERTGAPLIDQCPLSLECRVVHSLNLGSHMLFVGRIEETLVAEDCLTNGKPDVIKIKPIIFINHPPLYQDYGPVLAKAFNIGKEIS